MSKVAARELPPSYQECLSRIDGLWHHGRLDQALAELDRAQAMDPPEGERNLALWQGALAGWQIDLGMSAGDAGRIQQGLGQLEAKTEVWCRFIHPLSIEYNLGNGKKCLHDLGIHARQESYSPKGIALLIEAKKHYWKAVKLLDGEPNPELYVNLGNCLDGSARVVEAISCYDEALRQNPDFEMALVNKGLALVFLIGMADTFTLSQVLQARDCFIRGLATGRLPSFVAKQAKEELARIDRNLARLGLGVAHPAPQEADPCQGTHTPYRAFCLRHRLALSERAIYSECQCCCEDDLTIPKTTEPIGGDFVPRMEYLLNRLKAEFALARSCYYQACVAPEAEQWPAESLETPHTELMDGEMSGGRVELLRSSIRQCFGILDKIAWGVCDLFQLSQPREQIYFHSFWNPRSGPGVGRWDNINRLQNMGVVALYGIATELSSDKGEWAEFRDWRNDLEHGLLAISDNPAMSEAFLQRTKLRNVKVVPYSVFAERAMLLLQMTASAIFSFAFCVRAEGGKALQGAHPVVRLPRKYRRHSH